MKSRRWIAAAALAAAVVFLVMVTGERAPVVPVAAPAPVSSSEAASVVDGDPPDGDPPEDARPENGADDGGDRDEIIDALQELLDVLGVSAQELDDCTGGAQEQSDNSGNGNGNGNGNGEGAGADCGQQREPAAAEPSGAATITITGFAFGQPQTVAPGATVEVVNTDAAPHNVTANDGSFETPDLNRNERATFTAPTAPGSYAFTCTLHPEMAGTLIVAEGAAVPGSSAGDRTTTPGQSRPTGPAEDPQRGEHDPKSKQHETTAPGRGTTDGY